MEKIKTILDREPISSDYIRSKQDFANVVKGAKGLGKPYWQTNWFYGTVGVVAVAVIVTAITLSSSDTPVKKPDNNQAVVMTSADDQKKDPVIKEAKENTDSEEEVVAADSEETSNEEETSQSNTNSEETTTTQSTQNTSEGTTNTAARKTQEEEEVVKKAEIGMPNLAGVTGGPIAFRDFCDPLGIQVDGGVMIHQYTIQYRSCARDITARIRGNRLPSQVCDEIRDCGSAIEVTFSNFKAVDRDGKPVQLKAFSLITKP